MIDKKDDDFLETNIKGMMMKLISHWNTQMDTGRIGTEFADIRPSDMRVFGQLRGKSMRMSVIHQEMGFSRQAAQQAVGRLIANGLVKIDLSQGSLRDKTVTITEKGQRRRSLAAQQIREIEASCAEIIGQKGKEELREVLFQLLNNIPYNEKK